MTYGEREVPENRSGAPLWEESLRTAARFLFVLVGILMAVDIGGDLHEGSGVYHILIEVFVMLLSLAGAGVLWRQWLRERKAAERRTRELERVRGEAAALRLESENWRREAQAALAGLGQAIERQFERWKLTTAEAEVALLLLKGLSFKEIAGVRGASERTVRQQALAVYQKAGLSGRADLAAFFLEDLFLPSSDSAPRTGRDG